MLRIALIATYPASELLPPERVKPAYRNREHAAPWLRALCHGLVAKRDLEVRVFVHSRAVTETRAASLQGIECLFVPKREPIRTDPFHGYWPMQMALGPHLRAFRPDVVHGFGFEQGNGLFAARCGGASSVFIQGILALYRPFLDGHRMGYALHERLERTALLRLCGAVAETVFAADWARSVNPDLQLRIIPHGANPEFFTVQPAFDAPDFLVAGSLDRRKAPEIAIRALASMRNPEARLRMAGDGAARQQLERLAAELGVAGRVQFLGHIPRHQLLEAMTHARGIVLMSRVDTSPNIVTEGHAAGLPVIGARAGGIPEMIADDNDGYVVDVDDHRTLAERMDRLLDDSTLCARLGASGRAKVRVLNDPGRIADEHADFFRALAGQAGGER